MNLKYEVMTLVMQKGDRYLQLNFFM